MTFCVSNPPALLFNHSQLRDITLKNLALYPSQFLTTASSDTTIYWSNVNFQEFGAANERVWQFQGSGITNQNSTTINFIVATRYNINFEGPLSGWLTTSSNANVINAYENAINISYSNDEDKTIFNIYLRQNQPLQTFSFCIFQKDSFCFWLCSNQTCCSYLTCCGTGQACCGGKCIASNATCCSAGNYCPSGKACCSTGCMPSDASCCSNGTYCPSGTTCLSTSLGMTCF